MPPDAVETPVAVMAVAPPPPEQSVTDTKEKESNGSSLVLPSNKSESYPRVVIHEQPVDETVNPLGPLLPDDQQLVTVVSDEESKEGEKPTPLCPSDQQQNPMSSYADDHWKGSSFTVHARQNYRDRQTDINDPCNYSPVRNFLDLNERRDHRGGGYAFHHGGYHKNDYQSYYDDRRYHGNVGYQFHLGDPRNQRNGGYPNQHDEQRDHRNDGYIFHRDFINRYNPMDSLDTEFVTLCCSLEQIYKKTSYPVGASLCNPGRWICFLNCILQCVVHTVPLVLKLLKADHPDPCPRASDGFCCYCSLKLHADESIRLSGNVLYPKKFVDCLEIILPEFERGRHQDAHEFLRCLLDKLVDASFAPTSPSEESSSTEESNIVKEIFGGCLKSQLHCPECNHCSDKLEDFLDLNLEVKNMGTVMDALQSFTKVEVIEGFVCDKCKSHVNMEKHLKVEQAPEVLVIQLKRFENDGDNISKIPDMVKYQLELDLNPFMSSQDNKPQKYDLYGVVEHLGVTYRGHYVCYIRSSQTDWYLFNDERVYEASEASVLDNKAYLLFYVKQGSSPWFSTLLERKNWLPLDASKNLAEQGFIELGVFNDNEEESTSCGQDIADYCLGGPAGENEIGPSLPDLSRQFQGNANGSTSLDVPDKNEVSCSLGGPSGETLMLNCLLESDHKIGYVGGLTLLLEDKENVSPQGSHKTKEMDHSILGSPEVNVAGTQGSEVIDAGTQGGSPQKNEDNCSLLQSSHKHEDDCSLKNSCAAQNDGDEVRGRKRKKRPSESQDEARGRKVRKRQKQSSVANYLWIKTRAWALKRKSKTKQRYKRAVCILG